jgi:hypothetical protein
MTHTTLLVLDFILIFAFFVAIMEVYESYKVKKQHNLLKESLHKLLERRKVDIVISFIDRRKD